MKTLIPAALLTLVGCTTASLPAPPEDGLTRAAIGQTVAVGGPKVTPLAILEDSRCPAGVQCVWAGRVRISARIDLGSGSETREFTQGIPVPVADGMLELVEVQPAKAAPRARPLTSTDYRFAFRFMGGL